MANPLSYRCPVGSADWELVFDERHESELHNEELLLEVNENQLETRSLAKILPTRRTFLSTQPVIRYPTKKKWSSLIEVKELEFGFETETTVTWGQEIFGHENHSPKISNSDDYNQFYE